MNWIAENKEVIIAIIGVLCWIIREGFAPQIRHAVEKMQTKWHLDPATGELVLKGIDKLLQRQIGTAAMLANSRPEGRVAMDHLTEVKAKWEELKKMPKPFNDGINE